MFVLLIIVSNMKVSARYLRDGEMYAWDYGVRRKVSKFQM